MVDAGTFGEDARAQEPVEDETLEPGRCLACGGSIADVLVSLGSLTCHDCRGASSP